MTKLIAIDIRLAIDDNVHKTSSDDLAVVFGRVSEEIEGRHMLAVGIII